MLFNSIPFFIFFVVINLIYWRLPLRGQNYWLLVSSYFFYGYWDPRFLSLMLLSTLIDYFCGLAISNSKEKDRDGLAKLYLCVSIFANLGILLAFKMHGFFLEELEGVLVTNRFDSLHVIIPIGISFYTLQTMSYSIDIYRGVIRPVPKFLDLALYVSFFPQLVAGPIERAHRLIPQIQNQRTWSQDEVLNSLFIVIWGLFMKVVVADNLAYFVNNYFDTPGLYNSMTTLLSVYALVLQIYCDFAGYSYMAIGIAGLLGFRLSRNFFHPLLQSSPRTFWSRWHITLADWFRSYFLKPLHEQMLKVLPQNISGLCSQSLTVVVFALWHGVSGTFLIWGLLHAALYQVYRYGGRVLAVVHYIPHWFKVLVWFHIFAFSGVYFRVPSLGDSLLVWQNLFRGWYWQDLDILISLFCFAFVLFLVEIAHEKKGVQYFLQGFSMKTRLVAISVVYLLTLVAGVSDSLSFVYFQF